MNAEQLELFRLALLRVMDGNRTRFGLNVVALGHHLPVYGFTRSNFEGDSNKFHAAILDEIEYLTNRGYVEECLKGISKENRAWRISTQGIAFIDRNP